MKTITIHLGKSRFNDFMVIDENYVDRERLGNFFCSFVDFRKWQNSFTKGKPTKPRLKITKSKL